MLPLFENSTCPGNVKSSKSPDGISVSILMKGNCGIAGSSVCSCGLDSSSPVEFGLGEGAASFAEMLGMLGERFTLVVDSTSVPKVVRLSLVVELEGARPESLLASFCVFDRAVLGDRRWLEVLGRRRPVNRGRGDVEGAVATAIDMGGLAGMVSSYEMALRLSRLSGLGEGGACFIVPHYEDG